MRKENIELHSYTVVEHNKPDKDVYEHQRSRFGALASSWVHIVPVAVTFGILQLSFRNYYWADADAKDQRAKLSALQIAAKGHEILILVSLSSMVLHYTRKLMVKPNGISLGLLEAAYQSGLSSNPWTIGNWQALKHVGQRMKSRKEKGKAEDGKRVGAWQLVVLLVVFAFLALFIGPASAITLIPQLGWWHREDLIGPRQMTASYVAPSFSVYIPTKLVPTEVDKSHLSTDCNDATKEENYACPSARIAEIRNAFTIPTSEAAQRLQNTTLSLSEDSAIQRRILYLQSYRRAAVMVPNYLISSFASLIKLPAGPIADNYDGDGPFTLEFLANGAVPLNPLVGVDCNDTESDLFLRSYTYEPSADDRRPYNGRRKVADFDIRSIWTEDELGKSINGTELIFKDLTQTTKAPVLLALLRHEQNVTVCIIQSHWTPTSQWVLSTSNYDMATNFTFDSKNDPSVSSFYGYKESLNVQPIHIHEDWIETLNAANGSTKVLDSLIQFGITMLNTSALPKPPDRYFEATISQLLAKSIANGLSRIGAQYAADRFRKDVSLNELTTCDTKTNLCSENVWVAGQSHMPLAEIWDKSRWDIFKEASNDDIDDKTPLRTFAKPENADTDWTRLDFPVRRYGYAYAFQGITMYLSVALLCLHAAIVLVHVVYRVAFDCQTFDFGGSLGSLLVLAMGDKAPRGNLWKKRVAVVPYGTVKDASRYKIEVVDNGVKEGEEDDGGDGNRPGKRHVELEDEVLLSHTMTDLRRESRYPSIRI
jgi:hypothetical protein